jgi:gas vesicle protein
MSSKNMALGLAIGLGIGAIVGLLYAPGSGEENRQLIKSKSANAMKRLKYNLRWMLMTPRERYLFLWNRGGSLRNWQCKQEAVNQG